MSVATHPLSQRNLDRAVALHREGRLDQAIAAYRKACAADRRAWQPLQLMGIALFQHGALDQARTSLEHAVALHAGLADARYYLAEIALARGERAAALALLRQARHLGCRLPIAAFRLGELSEGEGDLAQARAAYETALALQADFVEAMNNLGNLLRRSGDRPAARACLERALGLRPEMSEAHVNLALLLLETGETARALEHLEQAVARAPDSAETRFACAVALAQAGWTEEAARQYAAVLEATPTHARSWNNLGVIYLEAGLGAEAQVCFERALDADAGLAEACNNLGNLESRRENFALARQWFARAIGTRADFAEAHNGLGMALWEEGAGEAAQAAFERALALRPRFAEAAANLGMVHQRDGDLEQARAWYARSLREFASGALTLRAATMLPPIMLSRTQIAQERARLARELERLAQDPPRSHEADLLRYPETAFYLAYHGENDRDLLRALADVYARACPSLEARLCGAPRTRAANEALRIGFVSRFFHDHSVGNFFNPIIEHLARSPRFDVRLFSVGYRHDAVLARVAGACTEHVMLDPHALDAGREAIAARELDVLVYADLGMDPYTYFLAFSRLAPTQCVLQGHSDTSGIPAVDCFVSSRLLEPEGAQALYSERLLLLDTMPMFLAPPAAPMAVPQRAALGLPEGRLYLCPMRLHKVHPDMDALVAGILRHDPQGRIAFFSDQRSERWAGRLQARVRAGCAEDAARVVFLPFEPQRERFRAMLASADVILDTPLHGGGTTCNLALSAAAPVVSLVGSTCRGRGPYSYYGLMGIDAGLAWTPEEYVERAVGIAREPRLRARLGEQIRASLHRLHRNDEVLAAYADLFSGLGPPGERT